MPYFDFCNKTICGLLSQVSIFTVDQQTGDIFLFTKDRKHSISEVYRYPYPQSESQNPFTLEHIGTLPLFWITGGDISPDGNILALTNKQEAFSFTKPSNIPW